MTLLDNDMVKRRWYIPRMNTAESRVMTWEEWQKGRLRRRKLGEMVAPKVIRRKSSSSDKRLKALFDGARGPAFVTDEMLASYATGNS